MAEKVAEVWTVTYRILKVNGVEHQKDPDRIRAFEEQIPNLLKENAEKLSDRADFPIVQMTATSESDDTKVFTYKHVADTGMASEWVTGRQ